MKENLKKKIYELKKNSIIDSAEKLFSENGIDKTTMDEISKDVGISKRTLYLYFSSKTALFNAILYKAIKALHDDFQKEITKESFIKVDTKEKLSILWNTLKTFKEEKKLYFTIITMYQNQETDISTTDKYLRDSYIISEKIHNLIKKSVFTFNSTFIQNKNIDEVMFLLWINSIGFLTSVDIKKNYLTNFLKIDHNAFFETFFEYMIYPLLS